MRMRQRLQTAGLAGVCVLLGACMTVEYAPMADQNGFGYRDHRNDDGSYTVLVVLPEHANPAQAREFWDMRAAEICPDGYRHNIFRAERPTVYYDHYGGRPGGYIVEGYLHCDAPRDEVLPVADGN